MTLDNGDVAYSIVTTADTTTTDIDYNGLDPDDVDVTNLDDEQAPTVTYNSNAANSNILIPDNNAAGITSTINVADDLVPLVQTVTLNIDHQRLSDLEVWLTRPGTGDAPVPLNTAGPTDVAGLFSGTQGDWVLIVTDNRRGKTGTLIDWSMTIDF